MKGQFDQSMGLIRLAHPLAFVSYLDRLGAPTERLRRQAGLPVYCDEPTYWVPLRSAWRFFDLAARTAGPSVSWQVSHAVGDQPLSGKLRDTVEHSPTLLTGLRRLMHLVRSEASQLNLRIVERPDS